MKLQLKLSRKGLPPIYFKNIILQIDTVPLFKINSLTGLRADLRRNYQMFQQIQLANVFSKTPYLTLNYLFIITS